MKTRNRPRLIGKLSERCRYTATELRRRGFGPKRLEQMRQSGLVRPRDIGPQRWYLGAEVCRWIDSH
jgi:hypothetical protein